MKGVLSWLVRWACHAGTKDFYSALAALVDPVQKLFPHNTLFLFFSWLVSWACCAGTRHFWSALAVLVSPVQNTFFPRGTLFQFLCPPSLNKLGRQPCWVASLLEQCANFYYTINLPQVHSTVKEQMRPILKVHKREIFYGSDFEFFTIS